MKRTHRLSGKREKDVEAQRGKRVVLFVHAPGVTVVTVLDIRLARRTGHHLLR